MFKQKETKEQNSKTERLLNTWAKKRAYWADGPLVTMLEDSLRKEVCDRQNENGHLEIFYSCAEKWICAFKQLSSNFLDTG